MSDEALEERIGAAALPLVLRAPRSGLGLSEWCKDRRERLGERLVAAGALLFRGFDVPDAAAFDAVADRLFDERLAYVYRSTPRTAVGGRLYTTTEYPAQAHIPLHNENAYQRDWPLRLAFCCLQPAARGGQTPLASTPAVTRRIPERIVERFRQDGVLYVRNYYDYLDLPWQTVFQTEDRADMEAFCAQQGIEVEWKPDGNLRTRQTAQALAAHPLTGEEVWFNQAHLFHVSGLDAATRDAMLEMFDADDLPRSACYGDGSPIPEADLETIRRAFDEETVEFDWQAGDVLLLDNMLVSHGRRPFEGERRVLAALGEARSHWQTD